MTKELDKTGAVAEGALVGPNLNEQGIEIIRFTLEKQSDSVYGLSKTNERLLSVKTHFVRLVDDDGVEIQLRISDLLRLVQVQAQPRDRSGLNYETLVMVRHDDSGIGRTHEYSLDLILRKLPGHQDWPEFIDVVLFTAPTFAMAV